MKEMHERVAELEQRLARLEAIVGDPDSSGNGGRPTYPPSSVGSLYTGYGEEPRVVSGGTEIRGSTWKPPVDNEWAKPVSFSS